MKSALLISIFFISSIHIFSQDITGIWRGQFYSGYGFFQEQYKYEVQINQLTNKSLQGVTYSYRTTVFYGKATLTGIYFSETKTIQFKEVKLVELKIADYSEPCLMECTLEYSKTDGTEYLKGTFTSINANTKKNCGGGTVYLERVAESDFEKEDFLTDKKPDPKFKIPDANKNSAAPKITNAAAKNKENIKRLQTVLGVAPDGIAGPKTIGALKSKVPGFTGSLNPNDSVQINKLIAQIKKSNTNTTTKKPVTPPTVKKKISPPPVTKKTTIITGKDSVVTITEAKPSIPNAATKNIPQKQIPVPDVIKSRENSLVKTITTNTPDIRIQLYDNGQIDGDTITVYHNNEVIAYKKRLTGDPITINIQADEIHTHHEFVMVADNLGSIPPNTALMVIFAGGKRYELFISSDNKKNAKVIINYQPG